MTRINANIPPKLLSDHHLMAEQKEIGRLPLLFRTRINNDKWPGDGPGLFTLGTGHLLFFMNKGRFAWGRANELKLECQRRGLRTRQHNELAWDEMTMYDTNGGYIWTNRDRILVIDRIIDKMLERLRERDHYGVSYMGEKETPETTIKRLLKALK